ncbi:hypothetical protein COY87_04405 [Candidatus Roizmanbacteria bacterium CG_4_10_14_0_8_um_filter_33_9]|uniref:Beta-xylosidase C-terminal Concanavalin A-like domain-containing protein n=1 Tax=Candidatus Roizmanbacteria bacterium CG_4_10_14_0_8_um_filter_33_9 TaxID=1974826 RepID=A0A2M7QIG8_9BACT|nr:MAG: hypothetical protein COY87_04405 [Candidatus Roizmanbacteria bacterium CG_4_10_14_0_8_um_filter_33_9]
MSQEKHHLPPITIVIVALIVLSSIPFFLRKPTKNQSYLPYHLEWSQLYKNGSIEIAGFKEGENWIGDYTYDSGRSLDGNTGINLFSQNESISEIKLNKNIDLSSFNSILITVYIESEQIAQQTDNFTFSLITNNAKQYSIPISPLRRGWNMLTFPLPSFRDEKNHETLTDKHISSFGFTLSSTKNHISQITIDRLWAERYDKPYMSQVITLKSLSSSFRTIDQHTYLNLFSTGINRVSFPQLKQVTQFIFTCKVIPENKGSFGFFMSSDNIPQSELSFLITHENNWVIEKSEKAQKSYQIATGKIQEFYNISIPFWLRMTKQGNTLSIDYSINGNDFKNIAKTNDVHIESGTIGLLSNGSFLIDYIDIKP